MPREQNVTLKVPPNSPEAERATLGSLLLDKEALLKVADFLKPEDFYYNQNTIIYQDLSTIIFFLSDIPFLCPFR